MTLPARSLRLQRYNQVQLDRLSYEDGEIFYDDTNNTLRLMDGKVQGGQKIATENWANSRLTTQLANYATLVYTNTQLGLKANLAGDTFTGTVIAPTFSGNLTGNVTGNLTGNVTGNLTGNVTGNLTGNVTGNADTVTNGVYTNQTYNNPSWISSLSGSKISGPIPGNAATATAFQTSRKINNVSFDGTADIQVPTLTNGSSSVSLASNGTLTVPSKINFGTAGSAQLESNNIVVESLTASVKVRTNTTNEWNFDSMGDLTAPGDITTPGAVSANTATITTTVTANSASVTADITVGANVNISTAPTQIQHATNKNYVDTRSLAMSIALS